MILYSTNSIKNMNNETTNLQVSGVKQNELLVFDNSNKILLQKILKELKILNTHMSFMTDTNITNGDLD